VSTEDSELAGLIMGSDINGVKSQVFTHEDIKLHGDERTTVKFGMSETRYSSSEEGEEEILRSALRLPVSRLRNRHRRFGTELQ